MRNVAWLGLGLVGLGCGSTKLTADNFDSGSGVDGGSCPQSSLTSSRHTFAWTFAAAASDGGAAPDGGAQAADGGIDAATPSRCLGGSSPYQAPLEGCVGGAWLRSAAAGPILTFDDGSALTWNPDGPPTPAPYVQQPGGDRVWAQYQSQGAAPCLDFDCTPVSYELLEIRDSASGTVRFYAQQGLNIPDLSDDLVLEIFGVSATTDPTCTSHVTDACVAVDRTEISRVLQTSPAEIIPFATPTQVTTPNGTYAVLWTATSDANVTPMCVDYSGPVSDNGFAATRLSP